MLGVAYMKTVHVAFGVESLPVGSTNEMSSWKAVLVKDAVGRSKKFTSQFVHLPFQVMSPPCPTEERLTTCARDVQNIGAVAQSVGIGAYIHAHSLDGCGGSLDAVALGYRVGLDLVR